MTTTPRPGSEQPTPTDPQVGGHDAGLHDPFDADPGPDDRVVAGPEDPAASAAPHPPLRRATDDKVIAGVAGGLGHYLGVDPVLIRIALVVLTVSGGAGVLLYIIAWIAIPEERPGELPAAARRAPDRSTGAIVLGAALLIAGGMLLADRLVPSLASFFGPLVLIALGAAVIVGARR